jgi:gamma-glutamylcyclotransferase (GGCT)/AIG2-like uncharacterized protein YtfP
VALYFAYGTTRAGFPHHRRLAGLLGAPAARVRTALPHAVVVPRAAACSNPGCELVHRMAVLVSGFAPLCAEGDLFAVGEDALAAIDRLELSGPYARAELAVVDAGGREHRAVAYPAREPERWRTLVERGGADALPAYPPELAGEQALKPCCVRDPGHPPPHDVVDPLAGGCQSTYYRR